ncbi:MAG: cyclic nucleotide-binding domain-containing protein [Pseudomonadota bacterium]
MDIARRQKLRKALRLIGQTRVFYGLFEKELQLFASSLRYTTFDAGTVLLEEGAPLTGLGIVMSGRVEVFLPGMGDAPQALRPNKVVLGSLKSGECFGEYAVFDDQPASASVVGVRPGKLVTIAPDRFRAILRENDTVAKKIYYNLLRVMVERLRASGRDFDVLLSGTG